MKRAVVILVAVWAVSVAGAWVVVEWWGTPEEVETRRAVKPFAVSGEEPAEACVSVLVD